VVRCVCVGMSDEQGNRSCDRISEWNNDIIIWIMLLCCYMLACIGSLEPSTCASPFIFMLPLRGVSQGGLRYWRAGFGRRDG